MTDLPRVTEILRPFTSYDQVDPTILRNAAAKGTQVHALCAGIAKGAWIPEGMIAEELLGYVNSFKKWADAQVTKYVLVEKRFNDEELGYTGQIDFLVVGSDGELYLVDLKTSSRPQKTYPVQMGAYAALLLHAHIQIKGAILVYLDKEGDFPDVDHIEDLSEVTSIFYSALDCYKYFHRKKGKKHERETESVSENPSDHGRVELHPEGVETG